MVPNGLDWSIAADIFVVAHVICVCVPLVTIEVWERPMNEGSKIQGPSHFRGKSTTFVRSPHLLVHHYPVFEAIWHISHRAHRGHRDVLAHFQVAYELHLFNVILVSF